MRIERARTRRRPIGLTSLIDVIFLLLLFFMLASTFSNYQALPLAGGGQATAAVREDAVRPALLRIHGEGRMDINGQSVSAETLAGMLADLKESETTRVAIWSGEDASVQDVVSAMDAVVAAGLSSILVAGK
ncbi:biopolymer transporter ExbD [Breoghania sp.]|uniref:ExbD/TolR family protein n=1 Tax=Breoghania sp. TaxID=2065378 RepID=UPI002AA81D12|nr:biopolymer transporter ExbD [Breoghania sp.]